MKIKVPLFHDTFLSISDFLTTISHVDSNVNTNIKLFHTGNYEYDVQQTNQFYTAISLNIQAHAVLNT